MRRLTRVHSRSVEQPVNLDEGDEYDWPFLYAVEVGHWQLTDAQAKALREFLDRGGFFMCDDFHGVNEWAIFEESMRRVFPDRPIVDIENGDADLSHDLRSRRALSGARLVALVARHQTSEFGGVDPKWRGIYDDKGRLVVAICHNMDLGDSWEHADNPRVPGEVLGARHSHRDQLRGLLDDALRSPDRPC